MKEAEDTTFDQRYKYIWLKIIALLALQNQILSKNNDVLTQFTPCCISNEVNFGSMYIPCPFTQDLLHLPSLLYKHRGSKKLLKGKEH